jgi:hypothetical protein
MSSGSPLVTVLMCVYNDDKFVGQAIESILAQDYTDFEFLIVDDGSTDSTPKILYDFAAKDSRIKILRQSNAGTTAAANRGLSLANGDLVARLDSDDLSFQYRLREQVEYLSAHPNVGLIGGGSEIIDTEGRVIGVRNIVVRDPVRVLQHRCIYQQSDVMFRRELVVRLGGYREKFRNAQDYDLWLRISEAAGIAKSSRVYGQWRLNGGGYTLSRMGEQKREVAVIRAMAARRRHGQPDGYEMYRPAESLLHRSAINPHHYQMVMASVLLKSLRRYEARPLIYAALSAGYKLPPLVLLAMTYLPLWLLRPGWKLRENYLNRYS